MKSFDKLLILEKKNYKKEIAFAILSLFMISFAYIDTTLEVYTVISKVPTDPIVLLKNKPVLESFDSLANTTEILKERERVSTESKELSQLHVLDILKYDDKSLGEWNAFRKRTYLLADSLINEFNLPVTDVTLYAFLMKTFYVESKYKAHAKNPYSSATGIIQWMSMHYKKYGHTRESFSKLSEIEQLPYVAEYFRSQLKRLTKYNADELKDWVDYYCIVYYPKIANKPDWAVMAKTCGKKCSPKCAYHANSGYDYNKDGKILKGEIVKRINKKLQRY